MSTNSYIGIREGDKVRFLSCHSDGYLSYNGVFLNLFYRNPEKVRALINLGDISQIGYNIEAPRKFESFHEASYIHLYCNHHIKTSWVMAYTRDCGYEEVPSACCSLRNYLKNGQRYTYLFDPKFNKWFLVGEIKGQSKLYELDEIFRDRTKFDEYVRETNAYDRFDEIEETIEDWILDFSNRPERTIIAQYNDWLVERKIYDLEFDYVKGKDGKRMYGLLYKRKPNDTRRKVYARHICIGDLVNKVLTDRGLSYF